MDERTNQLIHTAMGAGFAEAFMDDVGDDPLEHYGRKGMKWYENIFGEKDDRAAYANGGKGKNKTDDTRKPEKTGKVGMQWEHKVGKPGNVTVNVTVKQGGTKSSSGKRKKNGQKIHHKCLSIKSYIPMMRLKKLWNVSELKMILPELSQVDLPNSLSRIKDKVKVRLIL